MWNSSCKHNIDENDLLWDMMVILTDKMQKLMFAVVGTDKRLSIPIITENAEWTPHFILGKSPTYWKPNAYLKVSKIDPSLFGVKQ